MDDSKDINNIIRDVYHSPSGYASIKQTFDDARKKDKSIKMSDVKAWFAENVPKTTQLKGYNSYIPPEANFSCEIDLFFITKPEDLEFKIGKLVIDFFCKFCTVIMLKGKTPDILLPALQQAFITLGGTPRAVASDMEGSLLGTELNKFYKENNIEHIILRSHAHTAERMVKTLKSMIFKRLKHEPTRTWYEVVHECLVVLNYMRKSSSTGFIPNEARKPENWWRVKVNLEKHRLKSRAYPKVVIGDMVRLLRKRKNFEKEAVGIWSEKKYEVKKIEDIPNVGKVYYLENHPHGVLRSEILI